MSGMQDNTNPVMKYMPYIFPVLLLEYSTICLQRHLVLYSFKHDHINTSDNYSEVYY